MPEELVSIVDFGDNATNTKLCKKRMAKCSYFALTVFLAILNNWELFTTEKLARQLNTSEQHVQNALDELQVNELLNIKLEAYHE